MQRMLFFFLNKSKTNQEVQSNFSVTFTPLLSLYLPTVFYFLKKVKLILTSYYTIYILIFYLTTYTERLKYPNKGYYY